MTSYQSWRDTIDRKAGCRIPRYANFTPDLLQRLLAHTGCANGGELAAHFDMDVPAGIALPPPPGYEAPDFSAYYAGRELPAGTVVNANGVARAPSGFYHFTGFIHPLIHAESVEEILAYPLPDFVGWPTEGLADRVQELHRQGRFVAGSVGHTYESAWQIRGYEEFLTDLMLRPEMAEALLDRIADRNCITARAPISCASVTTSPISAPLCSRPTCGGACSNRAWHESSPPDATKTRISMCGITATISSRSSRT
jgi:hypothetical protein